MLKELICFGLSAFVVDSLRSRETSQVISVARFSAPFSLDPAQVLPIPSSPDPFTRYCHSDPATTPRLRSFASFIQSDEGPDAEDASSETILYGRCDEDSDCAGGRRYCIDNICRECREGYEFEDCGTTLVKCNEATKYTCSECSVDDDCRSKLFCREVFDTNSFIQRAGMPRNQCIKCEFSPAFAEIIDPGTCQWRCPIDKYYQPASSEESETCLDCPKCPSGTFYGPKSAHVDSFFTQCTNSTDVSCIECTQIGIDDSKPDFCATILSPSNIHQKDISVGDLGSDFPCRFFQCKAGWFLDSAVKKCKRCHITMCPPGEFLKDCSDTNPGTCSACSGRLPRGGEWIDPTNDLYSVDSNNDACQFTCPDGFIYDPERNRCNLCDEKKETCDFKKTYRLE
jgi:hypothetical protein